MSATESRAERRCPRHSVSSPAKRSRPTTTIRALGAGRYRLAGTLRARLTQACVATLEPLPQTIEEEFEVQFWPRERCRRRATTEVEVSSVPDVEPIEHGTIEVGRVVFETLSAALDPYPRKSGATLEWQDPESAEEAGRSRARSRH